MQTFKFRAEALADVQGFFSKLPTIDGMIIIQPRFFHGQIDGYEVTMTTYRSKQEVKLLMRSVPDSHVMMETLQDIVNYTGERE